MVALGLVFFVLFLAYYMGSGGSSKYPDMASEAFPKICFFIYRSWASQAPSGFGGYCLEVFCLYTPRASSSAPGRATSCNDIITLEACSDRLHMTSLRGRVSGASFYMVPRLIQHMSRLCT